MGKINKVIPSDIEAEKAVIGSCLIDKKAVNSSIEILTSEDFYREDNKIIFKCITNLFLRNESIDIITLKEEVSLIGKLEAVGGLEYIASLSDTVPTTANVEKYIEIVKEKSLKRHLLSFSNELTELSFDTTITAEELTELAENKVFELTKRKDIKGFSVLKDLLITSMENLEDVCKNGTKKGISTGFPDIDRMIGGLRGSELIIVAARPAMGKSAFVLNIATYVAKHENIPVLVFNLEMGKDQLTDRIICSEAMIDAKKYRNGEVDEEDWNKLAETLGYLSDAKIFIDDNSTVTISDIKTKCRKMNLDEKIGLIIIDYLQLITPSKGKNSREQEVADISRSLKILAKELNVPVIALSQLSRANEKRATNDKRPQLSDLRDSGSIEQDADIVMFIHRDSYYNFDVENQNKAEIIVAKNRAGEQGIVELGWLGQYTKFVNIEKRWN